MWETGETTITCQVMINHPQAGIWLLDIKNLQSLLKSLRNQVRFIFMKTSSWSHDFLLKHHPNLKFNTALAPEHGWVGFDDPAASFWGPCFNFEEGINMGSLSHQPSPQHFPAFLQAGDCVLTERKRCWILGGGANVLVQGKHD